MTPLERIGLALLLQLDPERAHGYSIQALRLGLAASPGPITSTRLKTTLAGLELPNPVGLAAGFDKNAQVIAPLLNAGFGFIEVGAATPRPQQGNAKPRLFRLKSDLAAINRFGFNNQGAVAIAERLKSRPSRGIVGLNLGANKDSEDRAQDYSEVLETCGPFVDFATVNVSSPNTEKLRDLQGKAALNSLLNGVLKTRSSLKKHIPIFLKIAPDLKDAEIRDIAEVAAETGIDGIIATNTTLSRENLTDSQKDQAGGLSGAPLFERSTRVLAMLAQVTDGHVPLIGVGGVNSAQQAYAKIKAGASAIQLYTSLVYNGLSHAANIARGLDELLEADGVKHVSDVVGIDRKNYT